MAACRILDEPIDGACSRGSGSMNRMDWTGSAWQDSDEEFHYAYTMMGRLARAGFALTPLMLMAEICVRLGIFDRGE